jgi:hypothetical protein
MLSRVRMSELRGRAMGSCMDLPIGSCMMGKGLMIKSCVGLLMGSCVDLFFGSSGLPMGSCIDLPLCSCVGLSVSCTSLDSGDRESCAAGSGGKLLCRLSV